MDLSKLSDADLVALQSGDLSKVSDQGLAFLSQPKEKTLKETGIGFAKTLIPSIGNAVVDTASALVHPLDTLQNLGNVAVGAYSKALPESVSKFLKEKSSPQAQTNIAQAENIASGFGTELAKPYQSAASLKETLATDPARVLADLSTVLTGGGTGYQKLGQVAKGSRLASAVEKVGETIANVGKNIDPTVLALRGGAGAISGASTVAKKLAGLQSGAGEEALTQAYKAGQTGGDRGTTFLENMRGEAPITDVLDAAKANLAEMQKQKQLEYRANMANVKADKTVMDIQPISDVLDNAFASNSFKGVSKDEKATKALREVKAEVDDWQWKNPAEYHTPEGLDALKQRVGSILESVPIEQKNTARVVKDVYNAIKAEISKQAPEYSKAMKAYTDASEQIREIEKALVGGNKTAADTSMRKLQSLMRNNAQTNYGYRTQLAKQLEQAGGHEIMPALAGQALNQWTPRGIQRATAGLGGLAAYTAGGIPLAATEAALSSPRLMGEVAYKGGQLSRGLRNLGQKAQAPLNAANIDPRILANYLYQINPQGQQ